jgi:hypothetical protein
VLCDAKCTFFSYIMVRTSYIWWDDNGFRFLLDQHASLGFYSAISLSNSPRADISLHPDTLTVLDLSPQCSVSIGEFVIILACVDIYQDGQRTSYIRVFFLSKTHFYTILTRDLYDKSQTKVPFGLVWYYLHR